METQPSYQELKQEIIALKALVEQQKERIAWLEQRVFSSKKDRIKPYEGPGLFDEVEEQLIAQKAEALEKAQKELDSEREKRSQQAKKESAANRPQKYCYQGLEERWRTELPTDVNLNDYDVIGKDVQRILHRDPAKLWVECIERPVLRRKADKELPNPQILQSPKTKPIIGGNHVAADMLAAMAVDKFVNHLPEYRQAKMYKALGATLPTSTINNWMHALANRLHPLYDCQCELILQSNYLQVDEVPFKIADQKGKACRNGYAWQFRDARAKSRGTFFYYHQGSRAGEIPRTLLSNFKGAIQTDGYKVYDYFESVPNVTLLGCMAHVRRKFIDAQNSHPLAAEAVKHIAYLYTLEEELKQREATPEQIYAERQRLAVPILDGLEAWMERAQYQCTPSDALGKALEYAYKLWPRIKRYTTDGHYLIDNNPVERGQRPITLGRKNYLFSQNDKSAEDNAIFYTLLESCEIVALDPLKWLTTILPRLANLADDPPKEEIAKLLPCYCQNAD
jgi:hypothetical protein